LHSAPKERRLKKKKQTQHIVASYKILRNKTLFVKNDILHPLPLLSSYRKQHVYYDNNKGVKKMKQTEDI